MFYVYLLKCNDLKTYVGCTSDLKARILRHQSGQVPATKGRLPIELIQYSAFKEKIDAFKFEKYLKSGSGRAFIKKHLIGNYRISIS
jgi:predicted GIY-YIG superfamily endonuclease